MANSKNTGSGKVQTTYTDLPGLKGVKVILSEPKILKENSSKPIRKYPLKNK